MGVKEVAAGEGADGISATLWDEAWLEVETELVAGRKTDVGTDSGTAVLAGHTAGSELEAGADDEAVVTAGAAAGF